MEQLSDDAIIAIVKDGEEEDITRLQLAWEILDNRKLKDAVLLQIEKEHDVQKLSFNDLLQEHPSNTNTKFSEQIELAVGSEIVVNERDIMGVYKNQSSKELNLKDSSTSDAEKNIFIRKLRIELIISVIGIVFILLLWAMDDAFYGKKIIQWGLIFHSSLHLFKALTLYLSFKHE
jgi:hypothetical protein